ncbi:MAG: lipopolysaccharide biosynthesis protein [Halarcobacter sp.]
MKSRKKAFKIQAVGGIFLTIISMLKGLVLLPYYFKYIEYSMYGYLITINSIIGILSFMNFGLNNIVVQKISNAYAKNNYNLIGIYFANSLIFYIIITLLFLFLGLGVSFFLQEIMQYSSDKNEILLNAYYITLITMSLSFFSSIFRGFAQSLLNPLFSTIVMILSNIIGIIMVIYLLSEGYHLISIPISFFITEVLIVFFCAMQVRTLIKKFKIKLQLKKEICLEYYKTIPNLFSLVISNRILENSHSILLTFFIGPESTTIYDILRKASEIILKALNVFNASLLGPYSHLIGESNHDKIKQVTLKIVFSSLLFSFLCYSIYIATNNTFIYLWIGEDIKLDNNIVIAIGLGSIFFAMSRLFRNLLLGKELLLFATSKVYFEGISYVFFAIILLPFLGMIAIPISLFIVNFVVIIRFSIKLFNEINYNLELKVFFNIFSLFITSFICLYFIIEYFDKHSWEIFFIKIIVTFILIVVLEVIFFYTSIKSFILNRRKLN